MKEKFTQGEWVASYGTLVTIGGISYEMENGFDSNLVAAAPEMYEALKGVIYHFESGNGDHFELNDEMLPNLRLILAKARGEK